MGDHSQPAAARWIHAHAGRFELSDEIDRIVESIRHLEKKHVGLNAFDFEAQFDESLRQPSRIGMIFGQPLFHLIQCNDARTSNRPAAHGCNLPDLIDLFWDLAERIRISPRTA